MTDDPVVELIDPEPEPITVQPDGPATDDPPDDGAGEIAAGLEPAEEGN